MSTSTCNIKCWQIGGSPNAMLVSLTPKERDPNPKGIWLPKSQIEHISRTPAKPGEWDEVVLTMPEWLAEKKGLI